MVSGFSFVNKTSNELQIVMSNIVLELGLLDLTLLLNSKFHTNELYIYIYIYRIRHCSKLKNRINHQMRKTFS